MAMSDDPVKRNRQLSGLKKGMIKKGEVRNPKGRPKNTMRAVIDEMVRNGYAIPTKTEIREGLIVCAFGTEEQIKGLITDKTKPMALRVIARQVISEGGFSAIEKILDRVVGRMLDITSNDKQIVKKDPIVIEVIDKAEQVDKTTEE